MTPDKTCHMTYNCMKLSEIAKTESEDLGLFKARVCSDPNACLDYQKASGVGEAVMNAIAHYNSLKQNTSINTESSRQK